MMFPEVFRINFFIFLVQKYWVCGNSFSLIFINSNLTIINIFLLEDEILFILSYATLHDKENLLYYHQGL